jgi:diacylglycerol kinase (ATP)
MSKPLTNTVNTNLPSEKINRSLAWKIAPNLLVSFQYAGAGIKYAFLTQRNFRIQTLAGTFAIALSLILKITHVETALIMVMSALVLVLELLNTALESVVDLTVKQSYHELAKIAKDCAAGAVLVSALTSIAIATLILFPPILEYTKTLGLIS